MNFNDFKNSQNLLSKEEMKKLKGGICQVLTSQGQALFIEHSQLDEAFSTGLVSRWCCASCASASWSIKD